MEKKRIAYLDFIKILAMFIVTIEHCAQSLSIQMFPEKIIPNDFFIAIHMPLFMIASGFVLNFDKIRATPLKEYIHNKFSRLIIPMFAWIVIHCIISMHVPKIKGLLFIYWYLASLFFSLVTIKLISAFIKNNTTLIIVSLLAVLAIPLSTISHTNYIFPFLIYGYLLRKCIDRMNFTYAILFGAAFLALYTFCWRLEHTVYISPLNVLDLNSEMVHSFIIRLAIGITGSTFIFLIAKKYDHTAFIQGISKYGKYTLVFYTMTTVINGITREILSSINAGITSPLLLDIAAIIFAIVQMYIIYIFARIIEKNKQASKILLGN